ncbi:hypothetical protein ACINWC743_2684 [Acinetobacter sp. WC-743]|nr:hypothetical protein ACINWC743_2684 [Acinetobacter sp. WC-743]
MALHADGWLYCSSSFNFPENNIIQNWLEVKIRLTKSIPIVLVDLF